jgi:hypothetical protein
MARGGGRGVDDEGAAGAGRTRGAGRRGAVIAVGLVAICAGAAHLLGRMVGSGGAPGPAGSSQAGGAAPSAGAPAIQWKRVHHETFDAPFGEPPLWTEDTYGDASPWNVDVFDDDGAYFRERGGAAFEAGLASFRSFRKAFAYGEDGWLTVELYGRDEDRDGVPESGGHFLAEGGKALLVSKRHTDGAIVRSTAPLPPRYRLRVTVSEVRFGGADNGSFVHGGKINGYDGDESAAPWRLPVNGQPPPPALSDNGVYFLCIVDFARPAPHNNVFIHHHRKVVLDTDNNFWNGQSWSKILVPGTATPVMDGSRYAGLVWLRGDDFGNDRVGNDFISWTTKGFYVDTVFADKYLPDEAYTYTIERDGTGYTLSIEGRFAYGGRTRYEARRAFEDVPPVWHYNQTVAEGPRGKYNQQRSYGGQPYETWPAEASYPDVLLFGDPHINYYEGSARYDDLELWLPEE